MCQKLTIAFTLLYCVLYVTGSSFSSQLSVKADNHHVCWVEVRDLEACQLFANPLVFLNVGQVAKRRETSKVK